MTVRKQAERSQTETTAWLQTEHIRVQAQFHCQLNNNTLTKKAVHIIWTAFLYVNVLFWFLIYATYVIIIVRSATAMIK